MDKGAGLFFELASSSAALQLNAAATLPEKGVVGLIGRSGTGKTNLLRALAGLPSLLAGTTAWASQPLKDGAQKRPISLMDQDAALFPHLTVQQNLTLVAGNLAGQVGQASTKILVEGLGIDALLEQKPGSLSGGQRKACAFAMAIAKAAPVTLLDEPFEGLDAFARTKMADALVEMGQTRLVIVASHHHDTLIGICDLVMAIRGDEFIAPKPTAEAYALLGPIGNPNVDDTGRSSVLEGLVVEGAEGQLVNVGGQYLILPSMLPTGLCRFRVKATDVALSLTRLEGTSIQNQFNATIAAINESSDGPFVDVVAVLEDDQKAQQIIARVTRAAATSLALEKGMSVILLVKAASLENSGPPIKPTGDANE